MSWLMLCGYLTLVQAAMSLSTRKYSWSPDDIQWEGAMWVKYENSVLPGILAAVGGVPQLKAEIVYIMDEASSIRNVSTSKTVNLGVEGNSIIAKICFEDGICWAAKIYENRPGIYNRGVDYGLSAATLVQRYCPGIPLNTPRGCGLHKLKYCFTDWVVGETLFDRLDDSMKMKSRTRQTIPIPQKIVTSLAEFVYNLTICAIPKAEMSKMKCDDFRDYVRLPGNLTAPEAMNVTDWVKHQFWKWYLLTPRSSVKPYDGLDLMLLLAWVQNRFSEPDESFVLHYWDLRMPNIVVDENDALVAIIDWDDVSAVPIKLSAIGIAESFFRSDPMYSLDPKNAHFFLAELTRIEQQKSSLTKLSQMFLHSREHMFLYEILSQSVNFRFLRWRHSQFLAEALQRSSQTIAMAASEWDEFSNFFYISRGYPVPDIPLYVEIQEALGIYGKWWIERAIRMFKRRLAKQINVISDRVFGTLLPPESPGG